MSRQIPIQIFGIGVQGRSLNVTANRRLNVYFDIQPGVGDKTQIAAYGTPGSMLFGTVPYSVGLRGLYRPVSHNRVFMVQRDRFYEVTSGGSIIERGTLASSVERCEMDDNGYQLMLVDGQDGYIYDFSADTFTKITDPGFLGARSVCFLDGYFITAVPGNSGKFQLSALYDGLSWNGLDYGVAESSPDRLVKVMAKHGVLYLFGNRSTEVWQNTGLFSFPFQRIAGAPREIGAINQFAVTAVSEYIVGAFQNRQRDVEIMRVSGYDFQTISSPDLAKRIYDFPNRAEARAYGYSIAGHDFCQMTWPTAGESWLFDLTTGVPSQVSSHGNAYHFGDQSVSAFGKVLTSHQATGSIYEINENFLDDDGHFIEREMIGNHVSLPGYGMFRLDTVRLDFEHGSVPVDNTTAEVRLSLSRDGGHTFGQEYSAPMGGIGQYAVFCDFKRLGRARDIVPRLRMTDPVKFAMLGATATVRPYGW